MKLNKYPVLLFMAGSTLSGLALSQEKIATLDEIVVTSSRIPLELKRIGTSVSILSQTDIEAHGNLSLTTILRQMPGVDVSSNGGAGSLTSLRIRGEESFRTLTIIDGIRVADPSGTQLATQMEHLLSSGVSRVEVLRGPQGLAYGADAGGVVNISSPVLNEGTNFNAEAQAGAFDTQQYSGSAGGANEYGDLYIQGVNVSTEGFNSLLADTELADNDGYENQTWNSRLGWNMSEQIRFELAYRNVASENEFDGCFDPSSFMTIHDCQGNYDLSATRLGMDYHSASMNHTLSYANSTTERENFAAEASSFSAKGELERWEYMGTLKSLPAATLVFGLDHELAANNGDDRENAGAYVEYLSDFSDSLFVTAGLRYDDNEDFGQHTSYRFTGAYLNELDNNATLKFKASIGTGFRAPSPFESAYNQGDFASPPASDIDLREETSTGYETGVEYFSTSMYLQAVYFDQAVDNAIIFDLTGFSGYLQDVGESKSKGVELTAQFSLNQALTLKTNYTFNDSKEVSGEQRIRRPKHLANLGMQYSSENQRLNLNAFYRFSQDTEDEINGSRVTLSKFSVLDLSASYLFGHNIIMFARVENITDKQYQEIAGYNTAGRAAYLGLRLNYGK